MRVICLCICVLAVLANSTRVYAQNPITLRPLAKSEQIDAAIELMSRYKDAVAQSNGDRVSDAYRRISIQLFKCAMLYGMLSKTPPQGPGPNAITFENVSNIFNIVSGTLYPAPFPNYQSEVKTAQQELLDLRKNNEKQKMFYLLRNCSELAEKQGEALKTAIGELMMN